MEKPVLPIHSPTLNLETNIYPPKVPTMPPQTQSAACKARGIARLTVHIPSAFRTDANKAQRKSPSRWNTLEFRVYYVIAAVAIPFMVWIPILLGQRERPPFSLRKCTWFMGGGNYSGYTSQLSFISRKAL